MTLFAPRASRRPKRRARGIPLGASSLALLVLVLAGLAAFRLRRGVSVA